MKKKIDYKMLCDLIMVSVYEGETPEQALERVGIKQETIPDQEIISIKHHNGLLPWAKLQTNIKSLEELRNRIISVLNKTINLTIFGAKSPYRELMSPLYNFYVYASNLDKRDGVYIEADKIANVAWYGELARKRLEAQTDKMFSNTPSKERFDAVAEKIKGIWGFTDAEMDMIRYFVCQSRHKGHNPSLNKSIYLWAKQKRTGKTTIARAIVAVLNGEDDLMKAGKYESTLPREMQYNAHEIPVATTSNASILDEALFVDSTRSYPQIKQMLTSADVQLNIKYKDPVHMEAKRYYIFTSNDNITQFIQDEEERRFFEIQLNRVPTQITFEEIYEIWKEFCTNAEPEENWQEWYNSFEYVRGRASEEIDYYINQFRDDSSVLDLLNSMSQTYVTPPMIVKTMVQGKATMKERTAVIGALDKLVGPPPPSRKSKYNRTDLIDAILDLRNGDSFEDVKVDNDIEVLPF